LHYIMSSMVDSKGVIICNYKKTSEV